MLIPVRCFSCGKPLSHLWNDYSERVEAGEEKKEVLDDLNLRRYCCRAQMMTSVDLTEITSRFKKS